MNRWERDELTAALDEAEYWLDTGEPGPYPMPLEALCYVIIRLRGERSAGRRRLDQKATGAWPMR